MIVVELTGVNVPAGNRCFWNACHCDASMVVHVNGNATPTFICASHFKTLIEEETWTLKTKRRRSEAVVNRTIDKVDSLNDRLSTETPLLPDAVVSSPHYQKVRECLNHRAASGYVNGFWMGFTIGSQT